ncbi:MAG: TIR domain-containing protein [Actinomycetota bacterium]|nr:TIR domain-containing protein [Actinomycetota bacterium]
MARVFVSYASEDLAMARNVHGWLVETGHEVFLDRDPHEGIALGAAWRQRLHERLRWADAVVCVVTSAFVASSWCTAEVATAQSRGSRLLPVRAEPDLSHPLLTEVQHTDLTQNPATARAALITALRRLDAAGGSGWPDDRSPFPGLRPFDIDRHRVFFGRADEIKALAELVRSAAEGTALLVAGPSGCGKSSLVRAGLVPVMADEPGWRVLPPILPGSDPVAALARELAAAARRIGLDWTVEHVRHRLAENGFAGLADELLLADPDGPQRRLLLVVDQFEELLTQAAPGQRARFAELLHPALTGPVRMVGTLRPEFLDQLLADPDLAALTAEIYPLRPLQREALRLVIEGPAQLAGIDVEAHLVGRLIDDTDTGEALPLLAFTLAQLADGVSRGDRLSTARYDQFGGVQGTLTHQADAALAEAIGAGGRSREEVVAGLLRLVTVDEQGRPTRWRIQRAELPDAVVTELDTFVTRRLLTTDTDNDAVVIGVAHEAFLSAWRPLAEAITANVTALRARRAVEHAATDWHDNGRPPTRLWGGGQLAATVTDTGTRIRTGTAPPSRQNPFRWLPRRHRVLVTDRVDLSPKARDFLHASIRRDRYRRRRATTALSVLLILALVGAGIAVIQRRDAQERQLVAIARQLIAQAEAALDTDPRTALRLGIAARHIHPDGETHSSLVNTLTTTRYAGALTGDNSAVSSMAFSPDGHTMVIGSDDGTTALWDFTDPAQPRRLGQPLSGHTSGVSSVAFTPDGRTLATSDAVGAVILWDLTDPAQPRRLGLPLSHTGAVTSAFAPDGRTLAVGSNSDEGTVILWDLTDRAQPRRLGQPLSGHRGGVLSVAFAPDGHTLATASNDNTAILWDLTDPAQVRPLGPPLTGHTSIVTSVAFAPDGTTLATGSWDNTVILWDLSDPAQARPLGLPLTGHTDVVTSVAFAPDGTTLATGSDDETAILWDLGDPTLARPLSPPLIGHRGQVNSVAFAPDGRTLATGSLDRSVILWDLAEPAQARPLGPPLVGHTDSVTSVAFAPDERTLATASNDNTVILWDLSDAARPIRINQPLTGHLGAVTSVAFAPDGQTLATASNDNTVILWDLSDAARPIRINQPLTGHLGAVFSVAFAPDGITLATGGNDGVMILWDVADRTQPFRIGQPLANHTDSVSFVAFAPDGTTLATSSYDNTVILWDLTDPTRPLRIGQPLTGAPFPMLSLAFTPNGRTLATGNDDGTVILWDLTDPTRPRPLGQPVTGHTGPVTSVAFSPDGRTLSSGSDDGTAILWNLADLNKLREHAAERACSITRGGLNREEWARYIPDQPYQDTCPG